MLMRDIMPYHTHTAKVAASSTRAVLRLSYPFPSEGTARAIFPMHGLGSIAIW